MSPGALHRDLDELRQPFDVMVVGGGVHGACITRLLAMQGLKVALVERDDFGAATSRNCAKLLHGGFRYVQHLDVRRIRESMRAQRTWLSSAPHLTRPLRFVIPAYGMGTRGPFALAAGMCAFHALAPDRNRNLLPAVRLPLSGIMSRRQLLDSWPLLEGPGITGAAWWYDAQMLDATRLSIEYLMDAKHRGAAIANYVECIGSLRAGNRVVGIHARDVLTGNEFEIAAKLTVNAAGPWANGLFAARNVPSPPVQTWMKNINLVVRRLAPGEDAFGFQSAQSSDASIGNSRRLFFASPWRDCTVIGTAHEVYAGTPDAVTATSHDVSGFMQEINAALPTAGLNSRDIRSVHVGLTPADEAATRARHSQVVDHHGGEVDGLITAIGVKFTTAPEVARKVADIVSTKLGSGRREAHLAEPTAGAGNFSGMPAWPGEQDSDDEVTWSRRIYGAFYDQMLEASPADELPPAERVFRSRILHGIRAEMVVTLAGALFRATDRAERGCLTPQQIEWSASLLSRELQWSPQRRERELRELGVRLKAMHSLQSGTAPSLAA